jgi:hypothetical protein
MKYYIIYKITNLINNKYYIGRHSTDNLDDEYLGSGKAILNAIKKYGKENFKKEIIATAADAQALWELEAKIIDDKIVNDPLSYNMTYGGKHYLYGLKKYNYTQFLQHQSNSGKIGGRASVLLHKEKFPNNEWHRKGGLAAAAIRRNNPKFIYKIISNNTQYLVTRSELVTLCKEQNWNYATLTWNLTYVREKTIKRGNLKGIFIKMIECYNEKENENETPYN